MVRPSIAIFAAAAVAGGLSCSAIADDLYEGPQYGTTETCLWLGWGGDPGDVNRLGENGMYLDANLLVIPDMVCLVLPRGGSNVTLACNDVEFGKTEDQATITYTDKSAHIALPNNHTIDLARC